MKQAPLSFFGESKPLQMGLTGGRPRTSPRVGWLPAALGRDQRLRRRLFHPGLQPLQLDARLVVALVDDVEQLVSRRASAACWTIVQVMSSEVRAGTGLAGRAAVRAVLTGLGEAVGVEALRLVVRAARP